MDKKIEQEIKHFYKQNILVVIKNMRQPINNCLYQREGIWIQIEKSGYAKQHRQLNINKKRVHVKKVPVYFNLSHTIES